ncbi:MAG: MipA/OmpV family protein [Hydrogenophaga sp.]
MSTTAWSLKHIRFPCSGLALFWLSAGAWASDAEQETPREGLAGVAVTVSVDHLGRRTEPTLGLDPVWAIQLGRFRLASGRAAGLLSAGRDPVDAGLSTALGHAGGWRLSTSLRIREGRDADDNDVLLRGLPGTRTTLLGRLSASRDLGRRWTGNLSATQDLLGNGAGLALGFGLGYRYPVSERTHWDAAAGAGWSNATARRSSFGIGAQAGRSPYAMGAGWDNVHLAWNLTSVIHPHWVAWCGLSVSQLQGAAARSPLVGRPTVASASVGLAYRGRY